MLIAWTQLPLKLRKVISRMRTSASGRFSRLSLFAIRMAVSELTVKLENVMFSIALTSPQFTPMSAATRVRATMLSTRTLRMIPLPTPTSE